MEQSYSKVTVYYCNELPLPIGFVKLEVKELVHFEGGLIKFKGFKQRAWREFISRPPLVILEGWCHPDPPDIWISTDSSWRQNRYSANDDQYLVDFDTFLANYVASSGTTILVDARDENKDPLKPPVTETWKVKAAAFPVPQLVDPAGTLPNDMDNTALEGSHIYEVAGRYERSQFARQLCLNHFGRRCQVCYTDLATIYGEHGSSVIQVHHIRPLSSIGKEYIVDPITDLIPVCPNCHAQIHQREPPFSIDEVRSMLVHRS